jgi:oligoribonuclease NrnB/cAMP/cGMP phosphodiesterase (DHH superfamily)
VEGHFSRLEQVEDRTSELKDKIEIKEKTEKILVKQLKSCERNMQKLSDSISNLSIKGIEEEEEKAKGIHNIFNKIITENFLNLKKVSPFTYKKPPGHQIDFIKIELPHNILSLKQQGQRTEKEY